jgi:integrase
VADNTLRTRRCHIKSIRTRLGDKDLASIQHDVKAIAHFLDEISHQGKHRTAQAIRSALIDVFAEAKRSGYTKENPAAITRAPRVKVQRSRLTLDAFHTILDKGQTLDPWVANSLLLALMTGQRVEDIAKMQFNDIKDNWLHVIQSKTGTPIRISLDLRLDVLGMTLGEAVSRCRDRVVSRHLTHHTRHYTKARPRPRLSIKIRSQKASSGRVS